MRVTASALARWSDQPMLWAGLALLSALPFVVAAVPLQPDFHSHTARYYVILNADHPTLAQFFSIEWQLLPNLGVDLVMLLLGQFLEVETAAHLIDALIPPLTIAGIFALGRAIHGSIPPHAMLSLVVVWSFPFLFGFVNFALGQALALLFAAGWIRMERSDYRWRGAAGLLIASVMWLCHMAAYGLFLVIVGLWVVVGEWRERPPLQALRRTAFRLLPAFIPLIAMLASRLNTGGGFGVGDVSWGLKPYFASWLLRSQFSWFDIGSAALVYALLAVAWVVAWRNSRSFAWPIAFASLFLFVFFLLSPQMLLHSYYADLRLLPAAVILGVLAVRALPMRVSAVLGAIGLSLFVVRIGLTTADWRERSRSIERELAVLEAVAPGSRIAVLARMSGCGGWRLLGYDHIASRAIIRRHAFVNTQWVVPGGIPMRPVYNARRDFNINESVRVAGRGTRCPGKTAAERLTQLPPSRFDYVWSFAGETAMAGFGLELVGAGPVGRLYRIRPNGP